MAVNRVIQQHFSMNYSYMERPAAVRCSKSCCGGAAGGAASLLEADEFAPLGLSPPAESELLRRRLQPPVH